MWPLAYNMRNNGNNDRERERERGWRTLDWKLGRERDGRSFEAGDDDDDGSMWLDLLSFTWRHDVTKLLLPKEKEKGGRGYQNPMCYNNNHALTRTLIMPFCGDFSLYSFIVYSMKQYHKLSKTRHYALTVNI